MHKLVFTILTKYCKHFSGKHSIKGVMGSCVPDMWSGRTTGTGPFLTSIAIHCFTSYC